MKSLLNKIIAHKLLVIILLGIVSGAVWFVLLYDPRTLVFTNIAWIYQKGGDLFQHQIGWEFFRQEAWHFPLGRIDTYGYPFGTNVSYTDSIPLFAYVFKLIFGQHGPVIQYLGLWELFSLVLQSIFAMLILGEFTSSIPVRLLGASLLVLSPILLYRAFEHDSLTAQWILLAGIWFVIRSYKTRLWRGAWILLFVLAILVHLYFVAMLIPLWIVSFYLRARKGIKFVSLAIEAAATCAALILTGYVIGLFSLTVGDLLAEGYGLFSWNLNGFINPLKYNNLLPQLPIGTEGQYEGFSYLGLGNLILLAVGLVIFFWKDRSRGALKFITALGVISLLYVLFSLSNRAYVGAQLLWAFSLPKKLEMAVALFRASGRFIWPVFYLIVFFGIISVIRKTRFSLLILLLALGAQFVDLQPLSAEKKAVYADSYRSPLQSHFWSEVAKANQHVLLLPAAKAHTVYEPFALYARQNRLTLNWGYFSRANLGGIKEYGDQAWKQLLANQADDATIYVIWDENLKKITAEELPGTYFICDIDGVTVVLAEGNKAFVTGLNALENCSSPR